MVHALYLNKINELQKKKFLYKCYITVRKLIKSFAIFVLLISNSFAEDISAVSEKLNDFMSNIVPGEGITETSFDFRNNHSPDFSILATRELEKKDSGNLFTQFSLFNTEQQGDERIVANLGFGTRSLSNDNNTMSGFNAFLDYDDKGNARGSIGAEARSAVLEFTTNYYLGISDVKDEKVLDGYDIRLASQIPYMHWAKAFIDTYAWEGEDRDDIEGTKMGSELLLSPNVNLELAYDDKDLSGLEDEWYAKLMFFHPPRQGPTAQDGISDTMWKEERDMSGELLTKVKRNNKIMIEFKGSSVISRTD